MPHTHRCACSTPGAAASEDVACLVQDTTDGTGSDTRQQVSTQGPLQQPEGPGGALILLPIGGAPQLLHDLLSLLAAVGGFASTPGSDENAALICRRCLLL